MTISRAEELVIAYATQTAIIRESKSAIKAYMRRFDRDEEFCDNPVRKYEASPEESCIRRHLSREIEADEMCESCKNLWPHVNRRFLARQERAKVLLKINALGKRLINPRVCTTCSEPFSPNGKERTCPECKLEREIEREEQREARQGK